MDSKNPRYSTGIKCPEEFWDPKKQRVKPSVNFTRSRTLNQRIEKWYQKVDNEIVHFNEIHGRNPNPSELRQLIRKENVDEVNGIIQLLDYVYDRKKAEWSESYCTDFKVLRNVLTDFHKEQYGFVDHPIYSIDANYVQGLVNFNVAKGNTMNYVYNKLLKNLRVVLNFGSKTYGLTKSDIQNSKLFARKKYKTTHVALYTEELDEIISYDYNSEKDREIAELIYLGCHLGLRYSDFVRLKPSNFVDVSNHEPPYAEVSLQTQKTGQSINIKAVGIRYEILKAREFNIAWKYSSTHLRLRIRQVLSQIPCMRQEIDVFKEGKKVQVKKYTQVVVHTFRRSFATNMAEKGVPLPLIKNYLGHSTVSQTAQYVQSTIRSTGTVDLSYFT